VCSQSYLVYKLSSRLLFFKGIHLVVFSAFGFVVVNPFSTCSMEKHTYVDVRVTEDLIHCVLSVLLQTLSAFPEMAFVSSFPSTTFLKKKKGVVAGHSNSICTSKEGSLSKKSGPHKTFWYSPRTPIVVAEKQHSNNSDKKFSAESVAFPEFPALVRLLQSSVLETGHAPEYISSLLSHLCKQLHGRKVNVFAARVPKDAKQVPKLKVKGAISPLW